MCLSHWTVAVLALGCWAAAASGELAKGEAVLREGFDSPERLRAWRGADSPQVSLDTGREGSSCVAIQWPAEKGPGHASIRLPLAVERLRGARLRCEALVKADNVAAPPHPWNGVKVMLHTVSPGGDQWMQQDGIHGSFDWKPVRFLAWVPRDATAAELVLGLEATSGRVWFDDLSVTVASVPRPRPAKPATGTMYKGHELPRLRGAMIGPNVTAADLEVLGGQWGANHIRWQLIWGGFPHSPADKGDLAAYDAWLEGALKHLDELLPTCQRLGILVAVDLHTPPGGRDEGSSCRIFHEKRFQDKFVEVWEKIARRYRGHKAVWAYDLVNEPVEGFVPEGLLDWQELAERTARRVRELDPDHAILIEPAPWGGPASLEHLVPIDVSGVVYSVHMYAPFQFTHQGIYGNPTGVAYPGKIAGKEWNKDAIREAFRPAIEFQRDYGVHLYIGEFSAIRWAPGDSARAYLSDVIDVMEEQGWDWAYHAFREWDGWSVEHGGDRDDRTPTKTPTPREALLRFWFAKNARPK
ncbi:MAG TPA: cellulase family glycosylhydrolase [Planctomycetota bacterium]|nr:cellulase family glycosylhydrolase [Planctomycetota bacterium]HRR82782.1 cellulase family glycosylhydrolase [Planctomycetota bacterium]HRT96169.1 cellulase family glycosylhydrolase [Planctomycetota bacterium]